MDLLRFTTAGSIDDGKSTLIGKLLHDTGNIKDDIVHSIKAGKENLNLAHVTDGLRSERDGGITIDIGYKYFNTDKRKFIIADAPGHFQYTKNLVTGASNADLIIVLIDARHGVTSQTRMHLMVASFLKLKHVLVAINKMDLVAYKESVFNEIKKEVNALTAFLGINSIDFIPISALKGDNVLVRAEHISWYNETSLLERLNNYATSTSEHTLPARIAIQHSIEQNGKQFCYGKVLSGTIEKAGILTYYTKKKEIVIEDILNNNRSVIDAKAEDNICLVFNEQDLLQRGSILGSGQYQPLVEDEFEIDICWLETETHLTKGSEYILRLNTQEISCVVSDVLHKKTITGLDHITTPNKVSVNEFARIKIKTVDHVVFDSFSRLQKSGRGILIDIETNNTLAAVIIV